MGGFEFCVRIEGADVSVALIVGVNDDDVGFRRFCLHKDAEGREGESQESLHSSRVWT